MAETFVLLHGSWHGGWAWEPCASCLRESGHAAHAPTYPGHAPGSSKVGIRHQDYVDSVVRYIERHDLRELVLVAHSFAGSVLSRVSQAIPERIGRLVFYSAFVVADGASVADELPSEETTALHAAAESSPDFTIECPWELFSERFIQDAPPALARSAWERLVPQPFGPYLDKLDLADFYRQRLPRSVIAVGDDHALPAGTFHPKMSARLGEFKLVEVGGSHEVLLTRPSELARALVEASHD